MENIFADIAVPISAISSQSERPKRNAFVFITTEPDQSRSTFEDLKQLEDVKEVYLSHGVYDIIARVSGESFDHLREVVIKKIKNIVNIKSTLTLTVV